ncbi:MAG: hypothetical protein ACK41C_01840 [Phenylobacterium sp.]|jgi:hypothetical protein|uniref:hypothetical protein n=1 Tax=Phenylobacterium sp. TaxID=1871053 RepID=UPI003918DC2C
MSDQDKPLAAEADRRAFLKTAGRFAAVTPPAMTLLLSTSMSSPAIAKSNGGDTPHDPDCKDPKHNHPKPGHGGHKPGHGGGHGGGWPKPKRRK